jgi:hypothetical protein
MEIMKVNRLDAHDRLKHLKSTNHSIDDCCQDLINQAPFGNRPFYIFAHARLDDDGINTRVIWQPRLTKPKAQTNSMLFKGYPGSDRVDIIWIIPKREQWAQYQKGMLTENKTVIESIHAFLYDRQKLEAKDKDDPSDQEIDCIYAQLRIEAKRNKIMNRLYKA